MYWIVLAIAVIIFTIVLINLFKTRKMILEADDAIFNGNSVRVVTGRGETRPLTLKSKDWRVKKWFAASTLPIAALFIIFASDLAIPRSLLILWIPLMSVWQTTVPSFLLTKNGIYLDERFYSWEKVQSHYAEEISIGDEFYGMFPDSTAYYAITLKMNRKKQIAIHKEDADQFFAELQAFRIHEEEQSARIEKV